MEGNTFSDVPMNIELRLRVEYSPNPVECSIDLVSDVKLV